MYLTGNPHSEDHRSPDNGLLYFRSAFILAVDFRVMVVVENKMLYILMMMDDSGKDDHQNSEAISACSENVVMIDTCSE